MFIPGQTIGPQTLLCPYCEDHETYQQLDSSHPAYQYVKKATEICRNEFNVADDGLETSIWLGSRPELVFEKHLNRYNIYLDRGSNELQRMYSGGHEAFHRACGEGKSMSHWIDEMFAVLFSLIYLDQIGENAHAEANRIFLVHNSKKCSMARMFAVSGTLIPDDISEAFYGRVYVVGKELIDIVGWDRLKLLATTRNEEGVCMLDEWFSTLPRQKRKRISRVLKMKNAAG